MASTKFFSHLFRVAMQIFFIFNHTFFMSFITLLKILSVLCLLKNLVYRSLYILFQKAQEIFLSNSIIHTVIMPLCIKSKLFLN